MKEKKYITTIIIILFILVTGIFYGYANMKENNTNVISLTSDTEKTGEIENENLLNVKEKTSGEESIQKQENSSNHEQEPNDNIYVHICGQVKKPGVYEFAAGSRISDGIEAAGGLTPKAASDAVNQAGFLEDGTQIYIPSTKEINTEKQQNSTNITGITEKDSSKVNLNLATKEELMSLPGIGEAKADSIITYREEHGDFKSIEDIKNITGIKDGVFNSISDYITV